MIKIYLPFLEVKQLAKTLKMKRSFSYSFNKNSKFIFIAPLLSLLCCYNNTLSAQTTPLLVPDDFDFDSEDLDCICTPGVINKSPGKGLLVEYTLTSGGKFTPDETPVGVAPSKIDNLGRLRLRLKVPVLIKPKTKLLLGFDHFREQYHFNFIEPTFAKQLSLVDGKSLKTSRASAYLIRSLNESNYLGLRARFSWNGNFGGILDTDSYYRQIRISGIYGVKKRDDLEWGVGLLYSLNFNRHIVLPFLLYNNTFNERWGLEAAFPVSIQMRYNFNPKSLLLFGSEFASARYALRGSDQNVEDYYFRHSEIQLGAKYERRLLPWIWANVHTGFQINFDSRFEKISDNSDVFEPDLKSGVFLRLGLFLSPPKK